MSEMQRRHVSRGANPGDSSPHHHLQGGRGKLLQHDYYSFLQRGATDVSLNYSAVENGTSRFRGD